MNSAKLKISDLHFRQLNEFLFQDSHLERVSLGLCTNSGDTFFLHKLHFVQEDKVISREEWNITWDMSEIHPFLSHIRHRPQEKISLIKFHNHPNGYDLFSKADNESDTTLAQTVSTWLERYEQVLSCVLLPDGKMFGRTVDGKGSESPLQISVSGGSSLIKDITLPRNFQASEYKDEFNSRNRQVLGSATHERIRQLKIGIVGYSGLGSPVFEQIVRLGCEHLVVIDPDRVEEKNLNRILNASMADAKAGLLKPDVARRFAEAVNPQCKVTAISEDVAHPSVVSCLAECDIIFGCMDSIDGRFILNCLATAYLIPYIDLGVSLRARTDGGINSVEYRIDFLSPGESSLLTREVYNIEDIEAAFELRSAPDMYNTKVREGYIDKIVDDGAPAVLPVNMEVAAKAIMAFLDRLHPFIDWGRDFYIKSPARISGNLACTHPSFAQRLSKEESFLTDNTLLASLGKSDTISFNKYRHVESHI